MIICNGIQEAIDNQGTDKWINFGLSEKEDGQLHDGHKDLIQQAKSLWPDAKLQIAVWSNEWWKKNLFKERAPSTNIDKQYMIDWAKKQKADLIYFVTEEDQNNFFGTVEYAQAKGFVLQKTQANNYFRKFPFSQPRNSLLEWVMIISYLLQNMGMKRDYIIMSDKDGWYNYVLKHFYDEALNGIESVIIPKLKDGDGLPYESTVRRQEFLDFAIEANTLFTANQQELVNFDPEVDITAKTINLPLVFQPLLLHNLSFYITVYENDNIFGPGKKYIECILSGVNNSADKQDKPIILTYNI